MATYKIVPEEEELAAIDRDLQFYPAKPMGLNRLSTSQVEGFNKDGYIKEIPVYTSAEITKIRSYFDELLEQVKAEGGDSLGATLASECSGPLRAAAVGGPDPDRGALQRD